VRRSETNRFFSVVSNLFHPITNAGIAFLLLTMLSGGESVVMQTVWFVLALTFSMIVPFLYFFYLKKKGRLETVDIAERMHRLNLIAFSILTSISPVTPRFALPGCCGSS